MKLYGLGGKTYPQNLKKFVQPKYESRISTSIENGNGTHP